MKKTLLVSGCDANYFPMLAEWMHSIRRFPEFDSYDIGIIDSGLTDKQSDYLKSKKAQLVEPDWPCPLPESKIKGRNFLKSCLCRPYIPDYFPGYETYFWMDADTWLQRPYVIDLFIGAAKDGNMALTAQVDRCYPRAVRVKWLGQWPWKVRNFYYSNALKAGYGHPLARHLLAQYVLSAGAFALEANAPHWRAWQTTLEETVKKGNLFTAEQLSLGIICYRDHYPVDILPSWTHWLCEFKPLWDERQGCFREPHTPHEKIGILHLSGWDEMRLNRDIKTTFQTIDKNEKEMSYRYPYYNGSTEEELMDASRIAI